MKQIKYFSMFSGIGGFERGIGQALDCGCEPFNPKHDGTCTKPMCVGYSEIDKYATKIYERHYPTHVNYGDATAIDASTLPDFDLLVGGFPCQAFSIAGKRAGFADTRGTLFFDIARVLEAKKPKNFILENVKGLLSHDGGQTFRTIISALAELGYSVEWQVLNSKDWGVPQNRERVYIVGHLGGFGGREVFPVTPDDGAALEYVGAILSERNRKWLDDGKQLSRNFPQGNRVYSDRGISATLASQAGGLGAKTGLYQVSKVLTGQPTYKEGVRLVEYSESDTVPTIRATHYKSGDNQPVIRVGNLYPSGGENGDVLDPNGISKTLKSGVTDNPDNGGIGSSNSPKIINGSRIRRLTPTECERLQGFPDGWTKEGTDGPISDTQRYKCCGNAVTVNVVEAVISRIYAI